MQKIRHNKATQIILHAKGFKKELNLKVRRYTVVELAELINDYFEFMDEQTINEKPKPFTDSGLCAFLGISTTTLTRWKEDEEYKEIFEFVDNIVYDHTLSHSLAKVYSEQVSIRLLGLADKQDHNVKTEAEVTIFELPNNNR